MDYVQEMSAFYSWLELHPLSPSAINVWYALMHMNHKSGGNHHFSVAESVLCVKTNLTDRTLRKARKELKEKGRIDYVSRQGKAPRYRIIPFQSLELFQETQQTNKYPSEKTISSDSAEKNVNAVPSAGFHSELDKTKSDSRQRFELEHINVSYSENHSVSQNLPQHHAKHHFGSENITEFYSEHHSCSENITELQSEHHSCSENITELQSEQRSCSKKNTEHHSNHRSGSETITEHHSNHRSGSETDSEVCSALFRQQQTDTQKHSLSSEVVETWKAVFGYALRSNHVQMLETHLNRSRMTMELILEAIERVKRASKPGLGYLWTILSNWTRLGIKTISDLVKHEINRDQSKKPTRPYRQHDKGRDISRSFQLDLTEGEDW
ncbi:DnaD domain protein [Bacillus tuaregi]|uniref:DnaD domain protein n=1 Tax=Bacillus tuaregi TaxID=1816695 RepID=UPI0008F8F32B|nr:DnaD domain protein [Bacillus tuaregi]